MRAKKSLGQNFLRDKTIIDRIVDALEVRKNETVIEIGPGQGALTERLLASDAKVIAVEFDRDLIPLLKHRFSHYETFTIVNGDALKIDLASLFTQGLRAEIRDLKLAANLPYNISTPILQRLMDQRHLFSSLVLMFQREVVERITAGPGGKERGFLSVLVESAFETEYLFDVPPQAFQPIPKVWSAVVRLTPQRSAVPDEALFRRIISVSFAQKRKSLLNNLKPVFTNASVLLQTSGVDGKRRAETLTLEEWNRLTAAVQKNGRAVD